MNKLIDDAIYTASPDIVRHRYNPLLGMVLTVAALALLWANSNVALFENSAPLSQWNLLISSCILCTGLTMVCYRYFGDSSAPLEKQSRERLFRSEYSFDTQELPRVQEAVERGDFELLNRLPHSYQPAAQVVCYRTESGSLIAAQVLRQQRPASEIVVFRDGEYTF